MSSIEEEDLFYFTSESVTEGHPDKLCDIISDTVVDFCLANDPDARCAVETGVKSNWAAVFGEVHTTAKPDYEAIVKQVYKDVGYDDASTAADYRTVTVEQHVIEQSSNIHQAVDKSKNEDDTGAGDQGLMIGFATNESEEGIPLTLLYSQLLAKRLTDVRKNGTLPWLRPDGKTQVTFAYKMVGRVPVPQFVKTICVSTQHAASVDNNTIKKEITDKVIKAIIPSKYINEKTNFIINPSGLFIIGGPLGDAGVTGRKIIVDTYGGWGGHGGGAFSGKDWTKVDRSGSYLARWIAKSLVKNGVADRILIQLSYVIGVAQPVSLFIDDYGTSKYTSQQLQKIVRHNFDMRPGRIQQQLLLKRPIFAKTASYGHFGRNEPEFTWEQPKKLDLNI